VSEPEEPAGYGRALVFSDGIAASRTMLAVQANAASLQERLGRVLGVGDDIRGTSVRDANVLILFHEVFGARAQDGPPRGLPQVSYITLVSRPGTATPVSSVTSTGSPTPKSRRRCLAGTTAPFWPKSAGHRPWTKHRRGETPGVRRMRSTTDSKAPG
jgi:hypothetical protein